MADCKRLATLKAYTAYLMAEVSVDNGYEFDLSGLVFRGRNKFTKDDPDTMVSVLEAPETDRNTATAGLEDGEEGMQSSEQWIWLVQGWTPDDPDHPTDSAYNLMADVKKATMKLNVKMDRLGNEVRLPSTQLGGLIDGIRCEPGVVRPPDEVSPDAFFWMRVVVDFHEDVTDPYSYV